MAEQAINIHHEAHEEHEEKTIIEILRALHLLRREINDWLHTVWRFIRATNLYSHARLVSQDWFLSSLSLEGEGWGEGEKSRAMPG
jgi:hypothetical protein